jgi:hypothetical protein
MPHNYIVQPQDYNPNKRTNAASNADTAAPPMWLDVDSGTTLAASQDATGAMNARENSPLRTLARLRKLNQAI